MSSHTDSWTLVANKRRNKQKQVQQAPPTTKQRAQYVQPTPAQQKAPIVDLSDRAAWPSLDTQPATQKQAPQLAPQKQATAQPGPKKQAPPPAAQKQATAQPGPKKQATAQPGPKKQAPQLTPQKQASQPKPVLPIVLDKWVPFEYLYPLKSQNARYHLNEHIRDTLLEASGFDYGSHRFSYGDDGDDADDEKSTTGYLWNKQVELHALTDKWAGILLGMHTSMWAERFSSARSIPRAVMFHVTPIDQYNWTMYIFMAYGDHKIKLYRKGYLDDYDFEFDGPVPPHEVTEYPAEKCKYFKPCPLLRPATQQLAHAVIGPTDVKSPIVLREWFSGAVFEQGHLELEEYRRAVNNEVVKVLGSEGLMHDWTGILEDLRNEYWLSVHRCYLDIVADGPVHYIMTVWFQRGDGRMYRYVKHSREDAEVDSDEAMTLPKGKDSLDENAYQALSSAKPSEFPPVPRVPKMQ